MPEPKNIAAICGACAHKFNGVLRATATFQVASCGICARLRIVSAPRGYGLGRLEPKTKTKKVKT